MKLFYCITIQFATGNKPPISRASGSSGRCDHDPPRHPRKWTKGRFCPRIRVLYSANKNQDNSPAFSAFLNEFSTKLPRILYSLPLQYAITMLGPEKRQTSTPTLKWIILLLRIVFLVTSCCLLAYSIDLLNPRTMYQNGQLVTDRTAWYNLTTGVIAVSVGPETQSLIKC